jgi:hypothetical protein
VKGGGGVVSPAGPGVGGGRRSHSCCKGGQGATISLEVAASKGDPLYKLHIYTMGDKGLRGVDGRHSEPTTQAVQGEGHQRGESGGVGVRRMAHGAVL